MRVAIVHDYLTQRGGAERVVLSLLNAFPNASLHTSLYDAEGTFPELAAHEPRTSWLQSIPTLARHHRFALPLLAPTFSFTSVDADLVVCSSSGWAHGVRTDGRKIVYCHNPARWLYQVDEYLRDDQHLARLAQRCLSAPLRGWDRRAAARADVYVANSTVVAARIATVYGLKASVIPPPPAVAVDGPQEAVAGIEPGFVLCVSRLLPYKNVDRLIEAMASIPQAQLVVVGGGPDEERLRAMNAKNVTLLGRVDDVHLRWLYRHSSMLAAVSYEDFGLTPVEAAQFGKPTVALRAGGYLDTIIEGETGVFVETATPPEIARGINEAASRDWSAVAIRDHAATFSEAIFIRRMREVAGLD
jgi:glycosyltransferase involved in cell wall biosynthesis